MRKFFSLMLLLAMTCLLWVCTNVQAKSDGAGDAHPELSDQEMLMPCSECHQKETPEIYEQWFNSGHGIGMVKCYQCHGTYENFKTVPQRQDCQVCHLDMVEKCPQKDCWACHSAHTFKAEKK